METEVTARSRNKSTSPAAAAASDLALEAIAALAGQRTSPSDPPARISPVKDSIESTIHASGLSPPPPSTDARAQPSATSAAPPREQQPSPAASPAPRPRRPLPSAAPADLAASTGLIPSLPRRAPSAPYVSPSANPGLLDKMPAAGRDSRDHSAGPTNSPPSRRSAIIGDGSATGTNEHAPAHAYADEIVVAKSNGPHSPPARASDQEDMPMEDVKSRSPEPYPKRKRSLTQNESRDESMDRSRSPVPYESAHYEALMQEPSAPTVSRRTPKASQGSPQPSTNAKSIPLGYWRDSTVPDVADRHAVIGFIDSRDRLRTLVHQFSRSGNSISSEYPLPPGPGGSWVKFERVVFEKHLIGMNHNQIKEYVKIRTDALSTPETSVETMAAERAAVKEAMRRAAMNPVSDNQSTASIAYGVDLPDYVVNANRPEKKRRMGNHYGVSLPSVDQNTSPHNSPQHTNGHLPQTGSPSVASAIQRSAIDLLPGTRPTKILLGYWRGSSEENVEDKHAVYGILGANDMFRVKVTRETRDGRSVHGNYPQGAGALWIHYDEVEFEKHIRHLSRPEVKEYVRVRQRQIDEGEKVIERAANEAAAVYDAQARVISAGGAAQSTLGTTGRLDTISFATAANLGREMGKIGDKYDSVKSEAVDKNGVALYSDLSQDGRTRREGTGSERRQSGHMIDALEPGTAPNGNSSLVPREGRHSLPSGPGTSTEMRAPNRPLQGGSSYNADRVERTNDLARREIARIENMQHRNNQRTGNHEAALGATPTNTSEGYSNGLGNAPNVVPSQHNGIHGTNGSAGVGGRADEGGKSIRQAFNENMGRLNKVWASQEASRLRVAGGEDAKIFNGVKYERKPTGPFQGKLVSPGTILSIDGEDYVEYRVLTKPTFF
ncbi:hypothetical protein SEUCBS139899_004683 [Sporothrix eucalyptigena]|uniref:Uncharacterized protein n=1 Tax=Sporothrix eucalyptigena TaxID=1812306 RepID=A0ABP0C4J7_9PEZI